MLLNALTHGKFRLWLFFRRYLRFILSFDERQALELHVMHKFINELISLPLLSHQRTDLIDKVPDMVCGDL